VNGTPSLLFSSSRVLRHGDQLSPLLSVVVMEVLSRMMTAKIDRGSYDRFSMGSRYNEELVVSHLLFANDTLIFVVQIQN
jgi:hypothetical protein